MDQLNAEVLNSGDFTKSKEVLHSFVTKVSAILKLRMLIRFYYLL